VVFVVTEIRLLVGRILVIVGLWFFSKIRYFAVLALSIDIFGKYAILHGHF